MRIFVIGVDGATFDLIKPWVNDGLLPNFKKLLDDGVHGELESTIPPITGPAWVSFQTGKNPGEHGIFDWLARDKNGYNLVPISSNSVKHDTLWDIIGQQQRKVGVINVPVTYPAREVNGFLVSGLLAPNKKSDFTYPKDLKYDIEENLKDYEILPPQNFEPTKINKWITALKSMIISRKELTLWLMNKYQWDFFIVHFIATDLVQHRMWHTLNNLNNNPILEVYKEVDKAIGEIMQALPKDVSVFIISDHGGGPLYYNLYLNNWLLKKGYLKLKNNLFTIIKRILFRLGVTPKNIYNLLGMIGLLSRGLNLGKGERYSLLSRFFLSAGDIDWKNTKAYSHGNIGQIYINTIGREPKGCVSKEEKQGLVDEIIAELKKMRYPHKKDNLFEHIYKKEEIYSGSELENAPEILLLSKNMEAMAIGVSEFVSNKIIEPSFTFTCGHRMEGIFIAYGQIFSANKKVVNARIIDLAPTILYSMGLKIPDDMDGVVLDGIFNNNFLGHNKAHYYSNGNYKLTQGAHSDFKSQDEDSIKKKLQDLGYVS